MKEYSFKINGKAYQVTIAPAEGKMLHVTVNGAPYEVELEQAPVAAPAAPAAAPVPQAAPAPAAASTAPATGGQKVNSPLPGVIVEVCVKEGQAVKAGQKVAVLEAMKMENEIPAPQDGVVTKICVAKGAAVNTGDVIVVIG